jgi:type VI secretion system protein ImpK
MSKTPLWRVAGDLVGYVLLFRAAPESHRPDLPALRSHLLGQLDAFARAPETREHPPEEVEEASFALVAWTDEMINTSNWSAREEWKKEPLQLTLYRTVRAGNEFFDHLRGLRPQQNSAREVYFLCLALGFRGQEDSPAERQRLVQEQYEQLRVARRALEVAREVPFMPPAYDVAIQLPDRSRSRILPGLLGLALLAGLGFGGLFVWLRFAAQRIPLPPA